MRLIDADELRKTMYHEAFETDTDMQKWDSGCWIRYKMFENALENAPTIDAEPVKHGEWTYQEYKGIKHQNIGYYVCSECGYVVFGMDKMNRYCPHCGARMDAE